MVDGCAAIFSHILHFIYVHHSGRLILTQIFVTQGLVEVHFLLKLEIWPVLPFTRLVGKLGVLSGFGGSLGCSLCLAHGKIVFR